MQVGRTLLVLRNRLTEAREIWRSRGLAAGLRALTSHPRALVSAVWDELVGAERYYLFAMDHAPSLERAREASASHDFVFASREVLEAAAGGLPDYVLPNAPYLEAGDRCLLQLDRGRPAGCTWATAERTAYMIRGVHWNLPEHSFYSYLGVTNPTWRGFGYQPLRKQMLLDLYRRDEEREWLLGYVRAQAMPALRGTRRSADRKVGEFRVRTSDGRVRVTLTVERDFWSTEPRW